MARKAVVFSRMSVGYVDSARSIVDLDAGDTGAAFSVAGAAVFNDGLTLSGAVTASSTLTVAGQITADSGIAIGGGAAITVVSTATQALDLSSLAAHESSSVTAGLAGVAEGDHVLIVPDSTWTGAYYDLALEAYSTSTAGEVNIVARNSTITAVDAASVTVRLTAIRFADFV